MKLDYYKMKKDYRFTFGREEARRVDEVIARGIQGRTYVVWVYYNVDWVDFSDDILEELGLEKIAKPGVNPALYDSYIDSLPKEEKETYEHYRMGHVSRNKSFARGKQMKYNIKIERRDCRDSGKGRLAWKNQGH